MSEQLSRGGPFWMVLIGPLVMAWLMILFLSHQVGQLRYRVKALETQIQELKK